MSSTIQSKIQPNVVRNYRFRGQCTCITALPVSTCVFLSASYFSTVLPFFIFPLLTVASFNGWLGWNTILAMTSVSGTLSSLLLFIIIIKITINMKTLLFWTDVSFQLFICWNTVVQIKSSNWTEYLCLENSRQCLHGSLYFQVSFSCLPLSCLFVCSHLARAPHPWLTSAFTARVPQQSDLRIRIPSSRPAPDLQHRTF